MQNISTHGHLTPLNLASSTSPKSVSDVQKVDYEFSGPFVYLKHHICNFVQLVCVDAQDAENEFAWPFDTLNHRFVDFNRVVF
jgi:hypothetical protein